MLTLKDLDNRVYSDKTCSEFSYSLKDERDKALKEYIESTGRRIIFIWEHEINDDWFWVGDFIEEVMQNA